MTFIDSPFLYKYFEEQYITPKVSIQLMVSLFTCQLISDSFIKVENVKGIPLKAGNIFILFILFLSSCSTLGTGNIQKANAHYKMGRSYLNENKTQMAFVEFQKALEFNPRDKEALNSLGLVYLQFEDLHKAAESFTRAINIDFNFSEAHDNLGVIYGRMNRWHDAINSFKVALKNPLYQTPEKAYNNLGWAYYKVGQIEEAVDAYKEAIKRMQDFYPSYYGLALCYNAKGQYGDAAMAINRAIELDPLYKGDKEKAERDFRNRRLIATGEEEKDFVDYLEILKY
ncbi:MAG: tetratricopeptide repeat protein [Nitrospirota bacterium]